MQDVASCWRSGYNVSQKPCMMRDVRCPPVHMLERERSCKEDGLVGGKGRGRRKRQNAIANVITHSSSSAAYGTSSARHRSDPGMRLGGSPHARNMSANPGKYQQRFVVPHMGFSKKEEIEISVTRRMPALLIPKALHTPPFSMLSSRTTQALYDGKQDVPCSSPAL